MCGHDNSKQGIQIKNVIEDLTTLSFTVRGQLYNINVVVHKKDE